MFDLTAFLKAGPLRANRLLLDALSNDHHRTDMYRQLRQQQPVLRFTSTADAGSPGQPVYRQTVVLLAARAHIDIAFTDATHFSNSPYRALGTGSFMLGLDGTPHGTQRQIGVALLPAIEPAPVQPLINLAWQAAAVLPLKQRGFDAAALAEQVALRFAGFLFGLPPQDHPLLAAAMRTGYHQLVYQIVGRHFEPQPLLDSQAKGAGAVLATRLTELLGQYLRHEVPKDIQEVQQRLPGFVPLLQTLVCQPGDATLAELTVLAGGLIAGMIGNAQAGVAIALDHLLDDTDLAATLRIAHAAEPADGNGQPASVAWGQLEARVMQALARNPPAALLPRKVIQDVTLALDNGQVEHLAAGTEVLLAIGSATAERLAQQPQAGPDPLIYGGGSGNHLHACLGGLIGTPLVVTTVRNILRLPGLTRAIDARTGQAQRLEKTWGFRCDKLALEYARDRALVQAPLAIVMPLRAPVAANAEKLKAIIAVGAPRIELKLRESNQVHFAWFLLLDNDSQLALFTTFDGDFDAYLKHFALEVGSLFDKLFECLADPPPLPVDQYPDEFVAKVKQYHRTPLGGYFFSAYPQHRVSEIHAAIRRDDGHGQGGRDAP